jgi:uncharacterized protein
MRNKILIIKPTHKCNLNCPYCYDEHNRECVYTDGMMSMKTVEKISEVFKDDVANWIWHGGEPLMMPLDFYYKANKKINSMIDNEKFHIDIQTNGTLINQDTIDMFKEFDIQPGLSFDGLNNENTRKNTTIN